LNSFFIIITATKNQPNIILLKFIFIITIDIKILIIITATAIANNHFIKQYILKSIIINYCYYYFIIITIIIKIINFMKQPNL
jgi:hypothetical protein